MKNYTKSEIEGLLDPQAWQVVNNWLERGDGIAVYHNVEIGHPDAGLRKFVSYGSSAAMLEVDEGASPPERLPDIGGEINWRYWLAGVYRGEALGE